MTFVNSFKKLYVTRQNLMLLASRVISLLNSIVVWWIIPLQDVVKYERTHLWQLIHASLLKVNRLCAATASLVREVNLTLQCCVSPNYWMSICNRGSSRDSHGGGGLGAATLEVVGQSIIWPNFSWKLHEIEEIWTEREGARPWRPLLEPQTVDIKVFNMFSVWWILSPLNLVELRSICSFVGEMCQFEDERKILFGM